MRILILANNDIGLYKFRKELIEELLKQHEIVISLPDGDFINPLEDIGCKFIDTPVDRRGINPVNDIKLLNEYRRLLKEEKPDLVITYTIKPNIYGGFASRLAKIPYVVNITGLGTAFQKQGMLRKLVTFMYVMSLKRAKTVFFENSDNMQIFLDEKIITKEQSCLLNGAGVNLEYYSVLDYPQNCDTIRFLFIGRVMKEKGIDELFEAMKQLRADGINCFLDVLGGYEENYVDTIKKNEAEGWMKYHGYQKDVRSFIQNCHCFVLPSWHEGMANTNLECAASGRPVITSRIPGCMEAVDDSVSGILCERQNSDSLYEALKKFCDMTNEERRTMGLMGRKKMENIFDKKIVVKNTILKL